MAMVQFYVKIFIQLFINLNDEMCLYRSIDSENFILEVTKP